jgi:signal transduction histidine kinase
VAVVFAVTGAAWVLLTDVLLYAVTRDPALVARIETAKGWTFVVLATVLLYVVTFRGALRLARAQAGVTAVIESIADGVLLLGPDRTIRRANPAAMRMLGSEGLVGMGAEEFSRRFRVSYLDGSQVPPREFVSQRVFDEGGPLQYQALLYPENGPERIVSITAAAVRVYAAEPPEMVVSVMHDVTESERLNSLRDQFFASAAHGLKTPVAIIKSNLQLLASTGAAHVRESVVDLGEQCDRMDLLVQNMLVFARIRSNSLQLYPREVELAPLVEQVTAAVAASWAKRLVNGAFQVPSRPRVHADVERITLVLRNLLDEALRLSSPVESVTVLLAQQGRDAEIRVRHQARARLGEAPPITGDYDELGINRVVTSTIVAAHGGELRRDIVGDETTAWLSLPIAGAQR